MTGDHLTFQVLACAINSGGPLCIHMYDINTSGYYRVCVFKWTCGIYEMYRELQCCFSKDESCSDVSQIARYCSGVYPVNPL
jgi:hypothetical protein